MTPSGSRTTNGLIAVIPVQRITAQLKKTLKSRVITSATLNTYDEHFRTIMASYPDPYPIHSQAFLDPRLVHAACSLQVTRLFLYRHNLTPACRPDQRRDALERCVSVAKDTAHYIERSMQQPSSPAGQAYHAPNAAWQARLRTMAPAFFCTHLWRCALVLCMRLEWEAASTIIQASAAIGDMRKNNIACGRNLAFFLDRLLDRLRRGATVSAFETDEEMMAYVSGDLQACTEEHWVWTGSETGSDLNQAPPQRTNGYQSPVKQPESGPLSEREMQEWGGWDRILHTVNQLHHEQQQQRSQPPPAPPTSVPPPPYPQSPVQQQQYPPPPPPQQQQQYPPPQHQHQQVGQYPLPPLQTAQTPQPHHLAPRSHSHSSSQSPAGSSTSGGGNGGGGGSQRISIKDIM